MGDKFTFTVNTDATQLTTDETADVLELCFKKILRMVRDGHLSGPVYDINGNKIGEWSFG